jgi:hypothetical protein
MGETKGAKKCQTFRCFLVGITSQTGQPLDGERTNEQERARAHQINTGRQQQQQQQPALNR